MEDSQNEHINNIFQEVAELSESVHGCLKNVHIVTSQVKKTLEPAQEANQQPTSYLKLGKENIQLILDLMQDMKETYSLLESVNEKNLDFENINVSGPFLKKLEDIEKHNCDSIATQKNFKIIGVGLKKVAELVKTGKLNKNSSNGIESFETTLAFSDFLSENPEVATSSPC